MMLTDCECWKELIPEYFLWGMAFIAFYYLLRRIDGYLTDNYGKKKPA